MSVSPLLTLDVLMSYKLNNRDMLPEIATYYANNKHNIVKKNTQWRKIETKQEENWLVAKKFNQTDDEKLYAQFRSILNKLSEGNFNELAQELTAVEIARQDHLAKLADLIFDKAIIEPKFSVMYAKLAREIAGYCVKENDKTIYFRELLINKCQSMFNECISFDPTVQGKRLITKEIAVGCMTFIGELYNHELLTGKIINSCFLLLLMRAEQNKSFVIESINTLMKVAGNMFNSKSKQEGIVIFDKVNGLIKSNKLPNKEKFALMDLMDLKNKNKW
ncbi:eukaryotic translation initiation factor 4G [Klosneuvirus KNV1]|uniref:Eukaryotic translation initiation factor 4G n=1 Tax=Klosneuvirus KNV1 TaxID=1977640 RepID=A0A1V0SJ99_9VIRU|nr:eukaryotic translation initiation factor 4G [Klosneuvirus KNV1]